MSSRLRGVALAAAALCCSGWVASAQIQSSGLGDVDPWGAGFLERGERGFGDELWSNSEADYLLALMESMDVSVLSQPERHLLSRVLRAPADAPSGDLGDVLLEQRIRLLVALGERRAAATLSDQADVEIDGIDPDVILSDSRLARGEVDIVCAQANTTGEGRFWSELRAICALKDDNAAAAELAIEIAGQQEGAEPWFTETAFAMLSEADTEDRPAARFGSGLEITMSDMAGLEPDADSVTAARPDLAALIANDETRSLELRLAAAAIAAETGDISPTQHRRLYEALIEQDEFEPESAIEAAFVTLALEPETPEPEPVEMPTSPTGPVDLRSMNSNVPDRVDTSVLGLEEDEEGEASDDVSVAEQQALAVGEALRQSASDPMAFVVTSRLFGQALETIPANEDTQISALTFAAAALTNGSPVMAGKWLDALPEDLSDAERHDAALLRGYALLFVDQRSAEEIQDITTALLDNGYEESQIQSTTKLFSVWAGLDVPLPVIARSALAQSQIDARAVSPGMELAMTSAADAGAAGEALLTVLTQTDGRAETLSGSGLATVLQTLQQLGASDEARAIALDAANLWQVAAED